MIGVDGHLKLTDFGLSKQLDEDKEEGGEKTARGTTKTICGTPEYIAPEVLMGKAYNQTFDWWTFGCVAGVRAAASVPLPPLHGSPPYP